MTRVALLWHMHQPFYQDLATGEHILPWVRLHALKDYWGMVAMLREFPDVRVTFNLVPSLLVQIEAFARDDARDRHLELGLKPADLLTDDDRAFCAQNFFHAHRPTMVDPYPRYAELLARREALADQAPRALASLYSVDELRDLQVWHKLVWFDPIYLAEDTRLLRLLERGRGFTESDKVVLREVELELLQRVIQEYRAAQERGQIEISTSPFYHPILPLLCDTDVYLRTHPHSRMPRSRFAHPEDASEQLARAADLHLRLFGRRPTGLWPSEGSVSDAMLPLVASNGFTWLATDEEILGRSLNRALTRDGAGHSDQPEVLYRSYALEAGEQKVHCGFRDHTLSDLIGFTYARWSADWAADDFVSRLVEAGHRFQHRTGGEEATVFVILDGENAWEHYAGQGRPFLRALYARLASHPEVRTVNMTTACAAPTSTLPSVFPGSWINGDYYIWIGHADDQRAWSQLADARRALTESVDSVSPDALARAQEELLIAEGSDWFWWYGDDHSSDHDLEFDDLFRRHVRNIYSALGRPVPEELLVTNITTQHQAATGRISPPVGRITPVIDGETTSYFEWLGAGSVEAASIAGAMHRVSQAEPSIIAIQYGADSTALYVRVDGSRPMRDLIQGGLSVVLTFLAPAGHRVVVRATSTQGFSAEHTIRTEHGWTTGPAQHCRSSAGSTLEIAVPFEQVGYSSPAPLGVVVSLCRGDVELERHPRHRAIELSAPSPAAPTSWAV